MIPDRTAFILSNTLLQPVPHAPENSHWRANLLDRSPSDVEIICAGDVMYEQPMANRILVWLSQAAGLRTRVLVSAPLRTCFPRLVPTCWLNTSS